ncbi:XAC2610-related protein [Flavobacterium sp. SM2513]|uniref:XAC2610-related protein n=1 Tax=Flavobacterium sp. SM2513 TaxID=3424766 RepID=UPI003D7F65A9
MKILLFLFTILLFPNCKNREESNSKIRATDGVESEIVKTTSLEDNPETDNEHVDTFSKKSQTFNINGISCFWELTLFLYRGEKGGTGKLELKNKKNGKIILNKDEDYYYLDHLGVVDDLQLSDDIVKDANFDGYKDIILYNRGASGSAGDFSDIFLFNPLNRIYKKCETLSGYEVNIDTITKTVSSYAKNGAGYNVTDTIHFGKNGKIKYSEVTEREKINKSDGKPLFKITYNKVMNDKIVKTKIDTVADY